MMKKSGGMSLSLAHCSKHSTPELEFDRVKLCQQKYGFGIPPKGLCNKSEGLQKRMQRAFRSQLSCHSGTLVQGAFVLCL